MLNIISGDLLEIEKGVIIHQVNNKHVMGAGLAKSIRAIYPEHYRDYMNHALNLGELVKTRVRPKFGIIGIVTQDGYGRDRRYTDYEAFEKALRKIAELHAISPSVQYYMPFKIGCGLAGGDWKVISKLIEDITPFIVIIKN